MKYLSLSKIRFAYVTANMFSAFQRKKTIEISEEWNHFPADSFIQMRETRRLVLHAKYMGKKGPFVGTGSADDKNVFESNKEPFAMHSICEHILSFAFFPSHDGLQLLHVCCKKNNRNGIGLGIIYTWRIKQRRNIPIDKELDRENDVIVMSFAIKVTEIITRNKTKFYNCFNFKTI